MANKSTSTFDMWTRPNTEAQEAFYSKHGHKRSKYIFAAKLMQLVWLLVATLGAHSILTWLTSTIDIVDQMAEGGNILLWGVAFTLSVALHSLLAPVLETFFQDKLDDDPNTDSTVWMPLMISLLLIGFGFFGTQAFLQGYIPPAELADRQSISTEAKSEMSAARADYDAAVATIQSTFSQKKKSKSAAYDKRIASWWKRTIISDKDKAFVNKNVAALRAKKATALDAIAADEATALSDALAAFNAEKQALRTDKNAAITRADQNDATEKHRVATEKMQAFNFAWLIDVILAICFWFFTYAQIRISVKSGIIRVRQFSVLDAHGGFFHKLYNYVIVDAWKRASHNVLTTAHDKLAVRTLKDFDGHSIETETHAPIARISPPEPTPDPKPSTQEDFSAEQLRNIKLFVKAWDKYYHSDNSDDIIEAHRIRKELAQDDIEIRFAKNGRRITPHKVTGCDINKSVAKHPYPASLPAQERAQAPTPSTMDVTEKAEAAPTKPETTTEVAELPDFVRIEGDMFVFQHDETAIKLEKDHIGRVVGVKYRKSGLENKWAVYGEPTVRGFVKQYQTRLKTNTSQANLNGFKKWNWIHQQFISDNPTDGEAHKVITL